MDLVCIRRLVLLAYHFCSFASGRLLKIVNYWLITVVLRLVRDDLGRRGRLVIDKDPVIVVLLRQHQVEAARADSYKALLIPALVVVLCDRALASDAVLTIFTGLCDLLISSHLVNSLLP